MDTPLSGQIHHAAESAASEAGSSTSSDTTVSGMPAQTVSSEPDPSATSSSENELTQWQIRKAWGISIPSLGIRAPVYMPSMKFWSAKSWDMLEEQMQVGLRYGTVAYPHSVTPGAEGSLIIAGHSSPPSQREADTVFSRIFAALPSLRAGDAISVYDGAKTVQYVVDSSVVVSPEETSILEQSPGNGSVLKLITCYPVGTTRSRLLVTARLAESQDEPNP